MIFYGKSVQEWSRVLDRPYMSVKRDFRRGWCHYPPRRIDGCSKDIAYKCWENMVQRGSNPKHHGSSCYLEKGITICLEWKSNFRAFKAHIGDRPSLAHSIDRIDNSKGYEPGNVRWATALEQRHNQTVPVKNPTTNGITLLGKKYWFKVKGKWLSFTTLKEAEEAKARFKTNKTKGHW